MILDHNKNPRNYGKMDNPDGFAHGNNPLCGDTIDIYLRITEGIITQVLLKERLRNLYVIGLMMTEALTGKSEAEAIDLFNSFHHALTDVSEEADVPLGKLSVLMGVKDYPVRVKCATLAWHTFEAALQRIGDISTE